MLNDKMPTERLSSILQTLTFNKTATTNNNSSAVKENGGKLKFLSFNFGSQVTSLNNNQDVANNNNNGLPNNRKPSFGSSVAIHKLRDTKWFQHNEERIFAAVIESGFIVERKLTLDSETSHWGVAIWKTGKEKSKKLEHITIYNLVEEKGKSKVIKENIKDFWSGDSLIRINNRCDKDRTPNTEAMTRHQIDLAVKSGQRLKWHNAQHFVYWCRYGQPRNPDTTPRTRQLSECLKWGHVGLNAGVFFLHQQKRPKAVSH